MEHLFLVPGDSPVGLRLPLQSLPWEPLEERQKVSPIDPMAPASPLPVPKRAPPATSARRVAQVLRKAASSTAISTTYLVRTALAVEPREGRLCVFLPPLTSAEDYVELASAIEDTAARLEMPVVMEGYTPPYDPRLESIKITPDPGVIEVNVHPAKSWRELVDNTTTLYEHARLSRLGTEKFMLDGRHTGTGGGNHLVLGAATPEDSPFLRRPDLLRSFVGYWLNHPSLSYLFSGVFIGPTSQAPRVDETRADGVYELEIAFSLLDGAGGDAAPWLVDRIFRNSACRRHRQHASRRILHRQTVLAGYRRWSAGPARTARLRNAAARAHESGAAIAGARVCRRGSGSSPFRTSRSAGARACTIGSCCPTSIERDFQRVIENLQKRGIRDRGRMVRASLRVPLPGVRNCVL